MGSEHFITSFLHRRINHEVLYSSPQTAINFDVQKTSFYKNH